MFKVIFPSLIPTLERLADVYISEDTVNLNIQFLFVSLFRFTPARNGPHLSSPPTT